MERFGDMKAFGELNGNWIHRLENVLTLSGEVHHGFDDLKLWLERVESVSNSLLRVNCNFKWVSRTHPIPTNSVRFVLIFLSTRVGIQL